jgi:hypothetical protein
MAVVGCELQKCLCKVASNDIFDTAVLSVAVESSFDECQLTFIWNVHRIMKVVSSIFECFFLNSANCWTLLKFIKLVLFSGPWALTRQILREEGPRGMFRGLVPTFAREMPGYFFFFGGYEVSRSLLTPVGKTKDEIGWLFVLKSAVFIGF